MCRKTVRTDSPYVYKCQLGEARRAGVTNHCSLFLWLALARCPLKSMSQLYVRTLFAVLPSWFRIINRYSILIVSRLLFPQSWYRPRSESSCLSR